MPALLPKAERLAEFFRRLQSAPPTGSFEEAGALIAATLNAVEDEFSGAAYSPPNWKEDGRMYPAMGDNIVQLPGHRTVRQMRHAHHLTLVSDEGAIEITERNSGRVLLVKRSASDRGVWDD